MKEAIKLAIEGEWKPRNNPSILEASEGLKAYSDEQIALATKEISWSDPLFWQALGKALGWEEKGTKIVPQGHLNITPKIQYRGWQLHWHRFIDHLAEKKSAESFFKELLPVTPNN